MRGIVGYFFSVNLASGVLSASLMGLWLEWRWMSAICTIEPILFLIGLFFVPESPYYLVKNGQLLFFKKSIHLILNRRSNN